MGSKTFTEQENIEEAVTETSKVIVPPDTASETDSVDQPIQNEIEFLKVRITELEKNLKIQTEAAELFQRQRDHLREALMKKLKVETKKEFSVDRFKHKNENIAFYTGFPTYDVMMQCYKLLNVGPNGEGFRYITSMSETKRPSRRKLSLVDEFFMTLVRIRLGLFELHISHLFNVSVSTVHRITKSWIFFMYYKLGSIKIWPDKDTISATMPEGARERFPNLEWIIDACEIQCERPSGLMLASQSYSSYKQRNTFKGLVACTPSGQIGFVSKLYTGNISDRELTIRSGFLQQQHNRGAMWLVDKGFLITDLADPLGVKVNMPSFVGEQSQLSPEEVFHSQVVASERIHVERAINKIKNFHIFDRPIPLSMTTSVNHIWAVCAFLTLFQRPIISA